MTTSEKQTALEKIAAEIKQYKGLEIARNAINAVPGEGNPDTDIMFIGEAPGFNEDRTGRPFVGQAGKLLEQCVKDFLGLDRKDVYITNIVKFRPPENRDPLPDEIAACKIWLDQQISIISPKIIATLGRFSMAKFLEGVTISRVHGEPRMIKLPMIIDEITIFPMYHPAAALRAGDVLRQFKEDFVKLNKLWKTNLQ